MPSSNQTDLSETHALFPSGEWEGFYTHEYGPNAQRHMMSFTLHFQSNIVTGSGSDEVAIFRWEGSYDTTELWCKMTKRYTSHTVFYDGHVDENGIWGTWNIWNFTKGGFHIWPKASAENLAAKEKESIPEMEQVERRFL